MWQGISWLLATKKMIIYTNSLTHSNHFFPTMKDLMDEEELSGDAVLVNGELFREQKFRNIQTFTGEDLHEIMDGTKWFYSIPFLKN